MGLCPFIAPKYGLEDSVPPSTSGQCLDQEPYVADVSSRPMLAMLTGASTFFQLDFVHGYDTSLSPRARKNGSCFTCLLVSSHQTEIHVVPRTRFATSNQQWNRYSLISVLSSGWTTCWVMFRTLIAFSRRSRRYSKSAWRKSSTSTLESAISS